MRVSALLVWEWWWWLVYTGLAPAKTNALCPFGWLHYTVKDMCYIVEDGTMPYNQACDAVNGTQGKVVTIRDGDTNGWLAEHFADDLNRGAFWLGLDDIETEGEYMWSDGQKFEEMFASWSVSEPKNSDDVDCMKMENALWSAVPCNISLNAICEIENINLCMDNNGGCEGFCTPWEGGVNCTCAEGYDVVGEKCIDPWTETIILIILIFLFPLFIMALVAFLWTRRRKTEAVEDFGVQTKGETDVDTDANEEADQDQEQEPEQDQDNPEVETPLEDDFDNFNFHPDPQELETPDYSRPDSASLQESYSSETMGGRYWRSSIHSTFFF